MRIAVKLCLILGGTILTAGGALGGVINFNVLETAFYAGDEVLDVAVQPGWSQLPASNNIAGVKFWGLAQMTRISSCGESACQPIALTYAASGNFTGDVAGFRGGQIPVDWTFTAMRDNSDEAPVSWELVWLIFDDRGDPVLGAASPTIASGVTNGATAVGGTAFLPVATLAEGRTVKNWTLDLRLSGAYPPETVLSLDIPNTSIDINPARVGGGVPEPGTWLFLLGGMAALVSLRARRR